MKKLTIMLLAGSILAMATFAFAGNKANTVSVSLVAGGLTFEDNQHLEESPVFGARVGYNITNALGIEALFDFSRTESTRSGNTLDFNRYGGDLLYHFWPSDKFVPYIAAGYAGMNLKGANPYPETLKTKGVLNYGLGFKYFVTENIAWRGDVRGLMYYYSKEDQHALEYTTGVYVAFGGAPVVSKLAVPPPLPERVASKPVVAPPPFPTATLSASPASITWGQESTLTWTSQNATNCEILPAIGSVQTQGSMAVKPNDTTLYSLNCKGEGGTAKSTADLAVTVPPLVVVARPATVAAAAAAVAAAERFCNKPARIMINFDVNKHDIKPQYHKELKTVGYFLTEFPTSHGEISGHTDSSYTKDFNQKLSERRANSVKEYIIKNFGIASERLTSKGYGKDKPIATNKTKEGRAKNRRIEANFVCE